MKRIIYLPIFFFLTLVNFSFAQLKKANKYYNNFEYVKAIRLYKKVIKKSNSTEALEKIAHSCLQIKNYSSAEKYYEQLVKKENSSSINHFYYGLVLKNTSKIDEAKEQFKIYLTKMPNDKVAQLSLKSCDDIKLWISQRKQYEIKPVENINSIYSDFSPVFYNDLLVFVSERTKDMVNYNTYSWNKRSFLNVYYTPIKRIKDSVVFTKKIHSFSSTINTNNHDGPVCFNTEKNTMYITRVNNIINKKDTGFVTRPQLYSSSLKKEKEWGPAIPFKYNNLSYSFGHPSISVDGKRLYFSSNMPGGKGGMDLYVCKKEGEDWGLPENLGDEVNTSLDELFPYIRTDDVLFFSSNGHSGFGGLDIFSASINKDKYSGVKNLGAILNSYTDDFGIVYNQDNITGYFSSDRSGGKGNDDIYSFVTLNNSIKVQGRILFNKNVNDPVKNVDVLLLTEDGKVINAMPTDEKGFFKFENLDPDVKYMVRMDEDEPMFAGKKKLYMVDDKGNFVRVTVVDQKGNRFTFKNLPVDVNQLPDLGIEDDVSIAGNILFGENPSKPLTNTKINLVNDRGLVVQTTKTNAFGAFVFAHLPNDENFMIKVDETNVNLAVGTKIRITNKNGKQLQSTQVGTNGKFKFSFLANDKNGLALMIVEDAELRFDFKGKLVSEKQIPLSNSTVNLINEKGEVLQSTRTDNTGAIKFSNISYAQDILITIDENDSLFKTFEKLFFMDETGKIIRAFIKINGKLKFVILPEEKNRLGCIYVDDPWLKVIQLKNEIKEEGLTIIENIYYNYGQFEVLPEAKNILDKVVNIMKNDPQVIIDLSSHTDSRSNAQYNLILSKKRADAVVAYIVGKGIAKNRISGTGFGESKLINKCSDAIMCAEEEHAKNRRTEFNIKRK